jgi:hypothetical protein
MREGLLWFDHSERPLNAKIERAAEYYQSKYGRTANTCFANPATLLEGDAQVAGLAIRATNTVLPNHFWLGVEEQAQRPVKVAALEAPAAEGRIEMPVRPAVPLLPAPAMLPAPRMTATTAAVLQGERAQIRQILNTMKATPTERRQVFDVFDTRGFAKLHGALFSEAYREGLAAIERVIADRERAPRMRDLVARFQLEAEQLHAAPKDTILPESGRVVRAHWFVLPGGVYAPYDMQPDQRDRHHAILAAEAKLLREVQQTFKVLELPTPKTDQALRYVENALEWLDRGLQRPVVQQSPQAPARPAAPSQPAEAAPITEPLPIQPPALKEVHEYYAAKTVHDVRQAIRKFERVYGNKPEVIYIPTDPERDLAGRDNLLDIPMRTDEQVHPRKVKLTGKAAPSAHHVRSAPQGAVPVRVGTGL